MKRASVGVRAVLWLNEEWGLDACHQHRCRIAKRINAMVKAEVMKERRRAVLICSAHGSSSMTFKDDINKQLTTSIFHILDRIMRGEIP